MMVILQQEVEGESELKTIATIAESNLKPEIKEFVKTHSAWPDYLFSPEHGAFCLNDWDNNQGYYLRTSGFVL